MQSNILEEIRVSVNNLNDRRVKGRCKHSIFDMVVITLCGVICGCEGWSDIALYGRDKELWFRKFLLLENGIPHNDTFRRLFESLCPKEFQMMLQAVAKCLREALEDNIISIDGKALRHSFDKERNQSHVHLVSAYDGYNGVTLAQIATDIKSNEITAIPQLLDLIDVRDAVVTLDAMGCQTEIVEKIISQGGDYVIGLKGNQGNLHAQVEEYFSDTEIEYLQSKPISSTLYTVEKGHGRIEERAYVIVKDAQWIEGNSNWSGLNCIGMVISRRTIKDKVSSEKRYFIASIEQDIQLFEKAVRGHWMVENNSHYVLDVTFHEDNSRIRRDNSPENMAVIRRLANGLLKNETSVNRSIKQKIMLANRDSSYLQTVLKIKNTPYNQEF